MTQKDILFMLPPGFADRNRREFCPECAELWGVLAWYPALQPALDIRYQPIHKPRAQMTTMLGDNHQNCPTLILSANSPHIDEAGIKTANGHHFIDNARDMAVYFAHRYGTPFPRGHAVNQTGATE
ncbi:MAG: DUF3088 family protein [Pseudomonadota bacterium]